MARSLSTEMKAVATASVVRPVAFVEFDFDSGDLYLWSGIGNVTYGGKTYVGAGQLMSINSIKESSSLKAYGAEVSLTGIPDSLVDKAKDEDYQGRSITIKLGAFDENYDIISSPVTIFSGFMDVMKVAETGTTSTISITCENRLIIFERVREWRFTDADQKISHPTDKGFEYVNAIQDKEITWGIKGESSSNQFVTGGGGGGIKYDQK